MKAIYNQSTHSLEEQPEMKEPEYQHGNAGYDIAAYNYRKYIASRKTYPVGVPKEKVKWVDGQILGDKDFRLDVEYEDYEPDNRKTRIVAIPIEENKKVEEEVRNPLQWMQASINALRLELDSSIVDDVQKRWDEAKKYLSKGTGIKWVKVSEKPKDSKMYTCKIKVIDEYITYRPVAYVWFDVDKNQWINPRVCNTPGEIIEWLDENNIVDVSKGEETDLQKITDDRNCLWEANESLLAERNALQDRLNDLEEKEDSQDEFAISEKIEDKIFSSNPHEIPEWKQIWNDGARKAMLIIKKHKPKINQNK